MLSSCGCFLVDRVLAGVDHSSLDSAAWLAIAQSASILATTIQVQDFKDIAGDARVGRATLPLVSERWARISVPITLLPWSVALGLTWSLPPVPALLFVLLGAFVSGRFLVLKTIPADKTSYQIYNVRRSLTYSVPY